MFCAASGRSIRGRRGALQFEERCDRLFWETETRIGSDIPSPIITDGDEEGSAYPIDGRVDDVCDSRGAK
jgi:hypothetical protein